MMNRSEFKIRSVGFFIGPSLFAIILAMPIYDLTVEARVVLGLSFWMGVWWISQPVPISVTAILPVIAFPLSGVLDILETAMLYLDKIIFLILGGFFLAAAIERTNLHTRFSLNILKGFGTKPKHVIGAFMLIAACLSAWMSNTATTLLMMPLAAAILAAVTSKDKERFGTCLMLGLAYSASIGGISTLIGTPPNAIFASLAGSLVGAEISFGKWMLIGVPVSAVSLVALWFYMTNIGVRLGKEPLFSRDVIIMKLAELGRISRNEKLVLAVFAGTVSAWLSRGLVWGDYLPMIDDSVISIIAALVLFSLPSSGKRILDLNSAKKIPWGILVLIGGGLALAGGFTASGLDSWIAENLGFLVAFPYIVVVMILLMIVVFTEFISNTASTALMLPIAASLSSIMGINPLLLMVPITIGASYGFILPTSTPPNAIVLSSEYVTPKKMAKVGLPLNLIFVFIVGIIAVFLIPLVW